MKKLSEILIAVILVLVLFLKADPLHWFMPDELQMILLCVLALAVALYAGIIFREQPADEREALHLFKASRIAYLTGTLTLALLIIIQDLRHQLDPALLLVLGVMIVTKLIVLLYSKYRN